MLQETFSFISVWYNLPFTIMLGLCILMAALQLLGLGGDGETDVDTDLDVDVDFDSGRPLPTTWQNAKTNTNSASSVRAVPAKARSLMTGSGW